MTAARRRGKRAFLVLLDFEDLESDGEVVDESAVEEVDDEAAGLPSIITAVDPLPKWGSDVVRTV